MVTVFHHISDFPDDSDAMALIREAGVMHVFQQDKTDDARMCVDLFNFPAWVGEELGMLDPGRHVLKVGTEAPQLVAHVRTELEAWITDTDSGMQGRAEDTAPFSRVASDSNDSSDSAVPAAGLAAAAEVDVGRGSGPLYGAAVTRPSDGSRCCRR